MNTLAIIDYGSGNLRSVAKACERAVSDHGLHTDIIVSANPKDIESASHVILPGVGAFGDCMHGLMDINGMLDALQTHALEKKKWFLGICVGMQLLFDKGFEHGEHDGLGWLKGEVKRFDVADSSLKVPHMGWNSLVVSSENTNSTNSNTDIFSGIASGDYAYFVHSYHAQQVVKEYVTATTEYGGEVICAVAKENIYGTQFHPEKSQQLGLRLLANFLKL